MSSFKPIKPEILIPEVKIQNRVRELAREIEADFGGVEGGAEIVAICTLKGSFIFFADLIRNLHVPVTCEFLGVSSYGDETVSSGEVKITLDLNAPLEGKNVLIVEDIVDSGLTAQFMRESLGARKPKSLKFCTLLLKPDSLKTDVQIDYTGFEIGNEFVVGYGLDYAQHYRGLPFIGFVKNEH